MEDSSVRLSCRLFTPKMIEFDSSKQDPQCLHGSSHKHERMLLGSSSLGVLNCAQYGIAIAA